jgi:hypothetical protein
MVYCPCKVERFLPQSISIIHQESKREKMKRGFFDLDSALSYKEDLKRDGIETTITLEKNIYWVEWVRK